jgi:glycine cleavage system H protein
MRRAFSRCFAAPMATATAYRFATTYFTKEHEWVTVEGKVGTVGITKVAVNELGAIMFVGLPVIGDEVTVGADLADVESVKTATKVYSPLNGKVVEINTALESDLSKICDDPESEGWIAKVEFESLPEADLMSGDQYKAFCTPSE